VTQPRRIAGALPALALVLSACAGGSPQTAVADTASTTAGAATAEVACLPVGDPADADVTVAAVLDEWSINAEPADVAASVVAFDVDNAGDEPHELVVIRTDTPASALPTNPDGAVDEAAVNGDVIGEVEPFPAGEQCVGVFDLRPGSYALVCNIVEEEDGQIEAHYQLGMRTAFRMTG
jgi:hypothetical protein